MTKRASMLCGIATAVVVAATPGYAQQSTSAPAADDGSGIADIVVTAQRRQESAQRAALAVDVVSAAALQNAGVVTAATLNAAVPSLYVAKGGGANSSFFIRGVGNFTNNGYSDPAVAFNVDGVYYGRPTSTTGTFYDLDRIEVLKGPQGTLYGRNATGGAINIVPARPRLGEFSGYLSAGYGRFDALDLEGAVNAPLGDRGALRIAGKLVNASGFNQDGTNDEVGQAFRIQLLGELTENFTVRIAGDYSHNGGVGVGGPYTGVERYTPGTAATSTSPANYTFVPSGLDPRSGMLSASGAAYYSTVFIGGPGINPGPLSYPFQDNTYVGANAEFTLKTGAGTLTFIPAYWDSKVNGLFNGPSFRGGLTDERDEQFTAEVRFDGKRIGPVDWLIGGYYYDGNIRGTYTFSQYTIQSYQQFRTGTKSLAAFGRLTAHLTDNFRLVGALRYTDDKKFFNGSSTTLVQRC
jgi:iron complex outermembrane receptor protein